MTPRDKRSLLHFAILIIVALGTTLFLLRKTEEAVREIRRIQDALIAR